MSAIYFPKPQPLSPKTATKVIDGVRKQLIKGQWVNVFGVPITDSVYYYWFEYLKLSEEYKKACANNGKGMTKLYKDFGNVFDEKYEGIEGFWDWWRENERGAKLFGIKAHGNSWISLDEAMSLQNDIKENNIKLFAVPTNTTKTAIKKQFNKLLAKTDFKKAEQQGKPKYPIADSKVDVNSLRKCLRVWKRNKVEGVDIFQIGCELMFLDEAKIKELQEDGRSKKKEYDLDWFWRDAEKSNGRYWKIYDKVMKRLNNKQAKEIEYWKDIEEDEAKFQKERKNRTREQVMDNWGEHTESRGLAKAKGRKPIDYLSEEMIEEAMLKEGYTISDKQRTKSKQALRTNTYRLLRKAEANINAIVEEGVFGVKH